MVSNIGDNWKETFPQKWPNFNPPPDDPPNPIVWPVALPQVTRQEFDALKAEIEALKILLQAAKKFDDSTGQPHCEMDEKVELIKRIAKLVGVELGDVFGDTQKKD